MLRGLGIEEGQALLGVEDVGLNVVKDLGFAVQLFHGAREAHPVEHLLLPGGLNLRGGELPPSVPVACLEIFEKDPVRFHVGHMR